MSAIDAAANAAFLGVLDRAFAASDWAKVARGAAKACDAYTNILRFDPNYFKQEGYFTLKELSTIPLKFYLTDPGTDSAKLAIAADIFTPDSKLTQLTFTPSSSS